MGAKKTESERPSEGREASDGWSSGAEADREQSPHPRPRGVWSSPSSKTQLESALRPSGKLFTGIEPGGEHRSSEPAAANRLTIPYSPTTEAELLISEGESSHDAWTVDRMVRRSTIPPADRSSLDRILEDKTYSSSPSQPPRRLPSAISDAATESNLGEALDLVDRSDREGNPAAVSGITADMVEEMEELYSVDDFTGALRVAELLLGGNPDHERARRCAEMCRERLEQLYINKIGSLTRVPEYTLKEVDLRWLGLDHRAGFVLSRVDGKATVEELFDICGMPRIEVLKTLIELLNQGAIRFRDR